MHGIRSYAACALNEPMASTSGVLTIRRLPIFSARTTVALCVTIFDTASARLDAELLFVVDDVHFED
jgi:hypothetical protein